MALEKQALDFEEKGDIERLLAMAGRLPADTKAKRLDSLIDELGRAGHKQVIVFTQCELKFEVRHRVRQARGTSGARRNQSGNR